MQYLSKIMPMVFCLTCSCISIFGQTTGEKKSQQAGQALQESIIGMPKELIDQRNDAYRSNLELYLTKNIMDGYEERAEKAWSRDYSSINAFERSVAANRNRWNAILNPPELRKTGAMKREPHPYFSDINAEWVELPLENIDAKAMLVFPENASKENPVPLVIAVHGIGSSPERIFIEDGGAYHAYGRELLKAGFAVLAPMNLYTVPHRNYIERLCRMYDTTLPGIELVRLQHLLDVILEDERIDAERIGMWGVSLGGMATMFWMPLEARIKAGVVSAWFNKRLNKMILPNDLYRSFIVVNEEHAFFRGWLTEFADHDVVSLICPRPLLVQSGKKDRIGHWPEIVEEFEEAKVHYEKLKIGEQIEIDVFEGGHEPRIESGIPFLKRWLNP
jgi:dienelactone hydrolase